MSEGHDERAGVGEPSVDLKRYAFVTAGLADGIELAELLAYLEIDPVTWERAVADWEARLLADLRDGICLTIELDDLEREARQTWERAIPPLDVDLRAWLDFQRGLGAQQDLAAYLATIHLRPGDLGALTAKWAARMATEPELMVQAAAILAEPAAPVRVPCPPRPRLPDRLEESTTGTGFFATLSDEDPLPFAGEKRQVRLAPPLSAPLPPAPKEDDLDATAAVQVLFAAVAMPFVTRSEPAPEPEPLAALPEPTEASAVASPLPGPEISVAAAAPPARASAAPPSPWEQSVVETSLGVAIVADPLPFREAGPGERAPAPVAFEPAPPQTGETAFVDLAKIGLAPTPFVQRRLLGDDAPSVDETSFVVTLSDEPVLPFSPPPAREGVAPPPAPPTYDPPHPQIGETGFVDLSKIDFNAGAPFLAPRREPAPAAAEAPPAADLPLAQRPLLGAASLTLSQYAAVETEIALDPRAADRVLSAYGLDSAGRRAHAEALRTLMTKDPTARETWEQAKAAYRAWRQSR